MEDISRTAQAIASAYGSAPLKLAAADRPKNLEEGYAVQDRVAQLKGWTRAGWKAGITSATTRATWAVDTPLVAGQLFAHAIHPSPHAAASTGSVIVEAEYCVRLASDIPARAHRYTREDMIGFIASVAPSIEMVASRFDPASGPHLFSSVADNSSHGLLVLGEAVREWKHADLLTSEVTLSVNGEVAAQGRGADLLGDPLEVVAWFANWRASVGQPLRAGDLIATGACAKATVNGPGEVTADFGPLGTASLALL
ncbi:2-keto-4-pentenoate hydratase [Ramlibacter sp.]|uniref:2-keto-4-pentenoate hydratase n=1 Tax=Ramlibacter sp. TaxID=1917967 RepID=UPI003D0A5C48